MLQALADIQETCTTKITQNQQLISAFEKIRKSLKSASDIVLRKTGHFHEQKTDLFMIVAFVFRAILYFGLKDTLS